jgi:ribosomal-protein-alanine N-acetyltransferase
MAEWPVELRGRTPAGEEIVLNALRRRDKAEWMRVRAMNRAWLSPWEATVPDRSTNTITFGGLVRHYNREARSGRMLPFVVRASRRPRIVGQMSLFGISFGSLMSVAAGYWVDEDAAGRGITPTALALAGDYALGVLGLHRIEVNIRPENANSIAVVHKLGFRDEGLRPRYLHIDGAWRDHLSFALTSEDLGGRTLMQRYLSDHTSHIGDTPPHLPGAAADET